MVRIESECLRYGRDLTALNISTNRQEGNKDKVNKMT